MSDNDYAERYPSYRVWLNQAQDNPLFAGADWSNLDLLRSFYEERIACGPSPELRLTWEKELAIRLGANMKRTQKSIYS